MRQLGEVLGLFWLAAAVDAVPAEVTALVAEREAARKSKNWAESDRLRDAIGALGWVVEDRADGARLKKK